MTELWETFNLAPVPEVSNLDRQVYEATYRGTGPLIFRGGALAMPAFAKWDADYLASRVGDAEVSVASYFADRRDYGHTRSQRMRFDEFLADLQSGSGEEVRYLFNNESCIFMRNEAQPAFHVGWAASPNAGLAPLAADFPLPTFIDPERFVLAVIILGSQENATDLHYDHGGEGKVLVQLRGRKRLLLLPPSAAEELRLNTLFPGPDTVSGKSGSRPQVDVHAQAESAEAAQPADARRLDAYTAELAPGDIAYWPPFWFHDVANLDPFTLAAGIMVDEIRVPALLMRHLSFGLYRALLAADGAVNRALLTELFRKVESDLLAESTRGTTQLWEWNERLGKGRA